MYGPAGRVFRVGVSEAIGTTAQIAQPRVGKRVLRRPRRGGHVRWDRRGALGNGGLGGRGA
jgi:hypothetical protein